MQRFASFAVLAAAIAEAPGALPPDVMLSESRTDAFGRRVAHRHRFEYEPRPGYLYVRSRAISSRCNDNYDEFPAEEIKKAYRTFVGKPVFVNHVNDNHRRARGVIIDAALHEDVNPNGTPDTWVEVLMEVDARRFPKLAEAVIKGWIDRTSMGTDVAYSVCTYCGNKATTPAEYCQHIPKMKGQRITRRTANGTQESVLVAERCYGLGFFENSLLVEPPADPTAYAYGVDTRGLEADPSLAPLAKAAGLRAVQREASAEDPVGDHLMHDHGMSLSEMRNLRLDDNGFEIVTLAEYHRQIHDRKNVGHEHMWLLSDTETWTDADLTFPDMAVAASRKQAAKDPRFKGVSLKQDDDGKWYVHTHRARSDSYDSPEDIPQEDVDEIESTGSRKVGSEGEHPDRIHVQCDRCGGIHSGGFSHHSQWGGHPVYEVVCPSDHLTEWYTLEADVSHFPWGKEVTGARKTAGWYSDTGETYDYEVEGVGEATVEMEFAGNPLEHTGRWIYDAFRYDDLPARLGGIANSLEEAKRACEEYIAGGQRALFGSRLAYGETKAPPQVDTLRPEACPVCGDTDAYNGQQCVVCGFVTPPKMFGDPDLEKAKQVDLRGENQDSAPQQTTLKCNHCGATHPGSGPASGEAKASTTLGAPSIETMSRRTAGAPPWAKDDEGKGSDDKAEPEKQGDDEGKPVQSPPDQNAPLAAGDTCPTCGQGTLEPVADDATAEQQPPVNPNDPSEPAATDEEGDPLAATDEDGEPVEDPEEAEDTEGLPEASTDPEVIEEVREDQEQIDGEGPADDPAQKPTADGEEPEDEEDEEDDDKESPFPPKKKKTSTRVGRGEPNRKEVEYGMGDQTNPAQGARNRLLAALAAQQRTIQTQGEQIDRLTGAVVAMARAAGVEKHPKFAALVTAADENNEEVATTDEQALAPAAKDDPESIGAAPSSANEGVTPEATTDVQSTDVAATQEPFNNLTDVTQPVAGTDEVPKGEAAHVETEVRVGTPSTDVPFKETGWTNTSSRQEEEPQRRLMASLRLARLRKSAGIEDGDDLVLGQAIASSDLSLEAIKVETETLTKVVAAKQPTRQPVSRSLVPQRAASVERTVPSVVATASATEPADDGGDNFLFS